MSERLRGDPSHLRQRPGAGYFGELYNVEDPEYYATELPIQDYMKRITEDGRILPDHAIDDSLMVPSIVPTLTRQELIHLVDGGQPTVGMLKKAIDWAQGRISQGLPTSARATEAKYPLPR